MPSPQVYNSTQNLAPVLHRETFMEHQGLNIGPSQREETMGNEDKNKAGSYNHRLQIHVPLLKYNELEAAKKRVRNYVYA
ncbi:hypothetical protein VNO77_42645 [Canavalia gladiata]|uniref:Uncharacterized protein n=1 Tax=Canavalia gladiata TaxID=3824 RepID=A0AAN9PPA6_CANGL